MTPEQKGAPWNASTTPDSQPGDMPDARAEHHDHHPPRSGLPPWQIVGVLILLLALASLLVVGQFNATPSPAVTTKATEPCVLSEWITPAHLTTQPGWIVTLTQHWYCAPVAFRFLSFDFGDRTSQSYWCLFNCFAGSRTFLHRYTSPGTFLLYASNNHLRSCSSFL